MISVGKYACQIAGELRKNPTKAEMFFWSKVRNKQFYGLKFLFQHPIFYTENQSKRFFIADFYCAEIKLIVELDGKIHKNSMEYDRIRTDILRQKNINIIHFFNTQVIENINKLLIELKRQIADLD